MGLRVLSTRIQCSNREIPNTLSVGAPVDRMISTRGLSTDKMSTQIDPPSVCRI